MEPDFKVNIFPLITRLDIDLFAVMIRLSYEWLNHWAVRRALTNRLLVLSLIKSFSVVSGRGQLTD